MKLINFRGYSSDHPDVYKSCEHYDPKNGNTCTERDQRSLFQLQITHQSGVPHEIQSGLNTHLDKVFGPFKLPSTNKNKGVWDPLLLYPTAKFFTPFFFFSFSFLISC